MPKPIEPNKAQPALETNSQRSSENHLPEYTMDDTDKLISEDGTNEYSPKTDAIRVNLDADVVVIYHDINKVSADAVVGI